MIDFSKMQTKEMKLSQAQEAAVAAERAEARQYLADTDWYVIRSMEQGKAIPEGVAQARSDARQKLNPPSRRKK